MTQSDFRGRRGILYYGQFRPREPYAIADGVVIVPSGWHMLPLPSGGALRLSRLHFVMPPDWSDKEAWQRFRDWVIFDAFVLINGRASILFDNRIFRFEDVTYSVDIGSIGDAADLRYLVNYDDVSSYLVDEPFSVVNVPALSYAELYKTYLTLPAKTKSAIEWFISAPPRSSQFDAFFGSYWALLHIINLIGDIIGDPPNCDCTPEKCNRCGRTPPSHRRLSQRDWRREQLNAWLSDNSRVEEYTTLIETAYRIRNRMSHGPLFDRSSLQPAVHGHIEVYDVDRAVKEYETDSTALSALSEGLQKIAHALLVDRAFGIKYFSPILNLNLVTICRLI
jgi:hypothetical protein